MSSDTESELFELGAINTNIMSNYKYMQDLTDPLIKRSYEHMNWFYITCKPFDKQYAKHKTWYESHMFIDSVFHTIRRYVQKHGYCAPDQFLTKEQDAQKHHINVLVCAPIDLANHYHNRNTNKYKFHVTQLHDLGDRTRVRDYMIKEARERFFKENKDYIYQCHT